MDAVLDAPRESDSHTVSVHAAARLLGVSPQLIYAMAKDGRLPVVRIGGRVLVRRKTVANLLGGSVSAETHANDAYEDSGAVI